MNISKSLLVSFLLLLGLSQQAYAIFGCVKKSEICVESGTKSIPVTDCTPAGSCPASVPVTRDCWQYDSVYECYSGDQQSSCSAQQLDGCYLGSTECQAYSGTTCTNWTAHYICSNQQSVTCGSDVPVDGSCTADPQTSVCNKSVGGVCVDETKSYTCYAGAPEQCNVSPNCSLSGTECLSVDNGLCGQQKQTYACSESVTDCAKEQTVTRCTDGNVTYGLETQSPGPVNQDFGKAAAGLSVLEALNDGMTNSTDLTIFKGHDKKCIKPVASGWLTNNCCKISVTKQGGNLFAKCNDEEIELAAARRASRTHYIGDYCDNKVLGVCLAKAQSYCAFDSMLGRIIQEQGREQLAALSASGFANAQSSDLSFGYYSSNADSGSWTSQVDISGNRVTAYQWPAYCKDVSLMTQAYNNASLNQDPNFIICPTTPEVYTASCALSDCGVLPADPRSGSELWEIQSVDPLNPASVSISKYVAATGSCNTDTEACGYKLTAWPAGSGGNAVIKMDLNWPLFMPPGSQPATQQVGNYMFRLHSEEGFSGPLPPTVTIDFTTDNGATWINGVQVPTDVKAESSFKMSSSPEVDIYGSCSPGTLQCQYRVVAQVNVNALPWGAPKSPNCGGFTMAQLSVLDFSKMNLNEWLSTLKPKTINQGDLAQKAASDTQDFYNAYTNNTPTQVDAPIMTTIAKASPSEGVGPFTTTMTVTGNWPTMYPDPAQNTNLVTSVLLDWGDGSPSEYLTKGANGAYVGTHTYQNQGVDVNHQVGITLQTTASGVKTSTFVIKNYADTPAPNGGAGGGASVAPMYQPGIAPGGAVGTNAGY